ncbi:MAG: helix-turn-helix domain-containing protein [Rikenellaceae bacterium]
MQFPERTFENLPLMVELMFNKIVELEAKIEALTPPKEERTTIDIDAAIEMTQKAKSTIYKLVRTGKIPAYKRGKKLYFIKEELEQWIFNMPKHKPSPSLISTNNSASTTSQGISSVERMRSASCKK